VIKIGFPEYRIFADFWSTNFVESSHFHNSDFKARVVSGFDKSHSKRCLTGDEAMVIVDENTGEGIAPADRYWMLAGV